MESLTVWFDPRPAWQEANQLLQSVLLPLYRHHQPRVVVPCEVASLIPPTGHSPDHNLHFWILTKILIQALFSTDIIFSDLV